MKHLYGGDIGGSYIWANEDWEPRSLSYFHSNLCPCVTGVDPDWIWDGENYIPVKKKN